MLVKGASVLEVIVGCVFGVVEQGSSEFIYGVIVFSEHEVNIIINNIIRRCLLISRVIHANMDSNDCLSVDG